MKKLVSDCCGAGLKVEGSPEGTSFYVCLKCKKACDAAADKKNKQPRKCKSLYWIIAFLFGLTIPVLLKGFFPHFGWADLILIGLLVFMMAFVFLSKWFRL